MRNKIIAIILCFYFIFLFIDFTGMKGLDYCSVILKYSCIILCLTITLLIGRKGHNNMDKRLLQAAFITTVFADLFLLILNEALYGIALFCIVQTIYIIRHSRASSFPIKTAGLIIFILSAMLYLSGTKNAVLILSYIYACISILSIYTAATLFRYKKYPEKTKLLVFSGLVLLLLCDINVAYYNLTGSEISGFLIWLFYLPSQLFLSLSGER